MSVPLTSDINCPHHYIMVMKILLHEVATTIKRKKKNIYMYVYITAIDITGYHPTPTICGPLLTP